MVPEINDFSCLERPEKLELRSLKQETLNRNVGFFKMEMGIDEAIMGNGFQ